MTESRTPPETPLDSWKQIAAHLNRDERTVRRWEKTEALPVHRHEHLARSTVYAYPSELDAWRESRKPAGATQGDVRRRTLPRLVLVATMLVAVLTAGGGRFFGLEQVTAQDSQVHRLVMDVSAMDPSGSVSRDGRYLSYTGVEGELVVRHLETGAERSYQPRLPSDAGPARIYRSVLSNQGTAAIQWQAGSGNTEIRLIDLETGEVTSLFSREAISWLVPRDFSADGESLAVHYQENDGVRLGILSVRDASLRPLVSTAWSPWSTMFFSPGSEFIAYDLPAAGFQSLRDVFIVSTDGSSRRSVTTHPADDRLVGWAPDGRSLLYASEREGRMPLFEVRISDTGDIGDARMIRPDVGRLLETLGVTARGTIHVAVHAKAGSVQVGRIDPATGRVESLEDPFDTYLWQARDPDWSPDGRRLVYARDRPHGPSTIWIRDVETGAETQVTPDVFEFRTLRWAPDGSFTVWGSVRTTGGLFRIDPQTGEATLLDLDDPYPGPTFFWLEDGRLAYRRGSLGGVAVRNMATGEETVLTRATTFAIAPDGRRLAFVERGDEDTRRIMVSAFDGEPRRVHEILPAGTSPLGFLLWTADGARIIFGRWVDDQPVPTAFSVPVSGGPATEFDSRIPGHNSLAIHPDGRTVAFETLDSRTEIWAYDGVIPGISAGGR